VFAGLFESMPILFKSGVDIYDNTGSGSETMISDPIYIYWGYSRVRGGGTNHIRLRPGELRVFDHNVHLA
jgi:hypothetical protein